ncbi:MAG: hypothetical protein HPY45_15145 [Anaerolineae bacterium]|nr:hypothetical protein [Anaerolineae bacterium]
MRKFALLAAVFVWLLSACDVMQLAAPPPEPTQPPTLTVPIPTLTPLPTLGAARALDAAFCWKSPIDEDEFNIVRFFPGGEVIDLFVQGYGSCQESWKAVAGYLSPATMSRYNHGTYQFDGKEVRFALAPPNSDQLMGTISGRMQEDGKLLLQRQGAETWEYTLVYASGGE